MSLAKKILGLTGPTGAGKSTVAAVLAQKGCRIIDCDKLARDIVQEEPSLTRLMEAFGSDIAPGGMLDRSLLAKRAFQDKEHTAQLNKITHPAILEEIQRQIQLQREKGEQVVVIDAALLLEGGVDSLCDAIIVVTAPEQTRLFRIMQRDGLTREQAIARMAAQQKDEFYKSRANYCLDGAQSMERISVDAQSLLEEFLGKGV